MICIIQARMNSQRLYGKVLKKIFDKKILFLLVQRLKKAKNISNIIVATSDSKSDLKIVSFCKKNKIEHFTGSLTNVASRFAKVLKKKNCFCFIRISADSPLIDPILIDKIIHLSKKKKFDIVTNVFPRSFPSGQSIEIIRSELFLKNIKYFNNKDKEHITKYFYRNYKKFKIINLKSNTNLSNYKMSIDTLEDYNKLIKMSKRIAMTKLLNLNYKKLLKYF